MHLHPGSGSPCIVNTEASTGNTRNTRNSSSTGIICTTRPHMTCSARCLPSPAPRLPCEAFGTQQASNLLVQGAISDAEAWASAPYEADQRRHQENHKKRSMILQGTIPIKLTGVAAWKTRNSHVSATLSCLTQLRSHGLASALHPCLHDLPYGCSCHCSQATGCPPTLPGCWMPGPSACWGGTLAAPPCAWGASTGPGSTPTSDFADRYASSTCHQLPVLVLNL